MDTNRAARGRIAQIATLTLGALAGLTTAIVAGTAVAFRAAESSPPIIEATHLPPLLTANDEPVELRYDVHCLSGDQPEGTEDVSCEAAGTIFVRAGQRGPFHELRLREDQGASEGRFVAALPVEIARSETGFSYYAVLRSVASGATVTLPAGGPSAPQRSYPLRRAMDAALGTHEFGRIRQANARVVEASWGTGAREVGLEQGRNLPAIGGSGFDVGRDGSVYVLDEANRRVLRWRPGARAPTSVPLSIDGTLADMSVGDDGAIYVLEPPNGARKAAVLRMFGPDGAPHGVVEMAERATQLRIGADGRPVVLQHPSGQWMSAAEDGRLLGPAEQRASGRSGRSVRGDGEVIVLRRDSEIRAAIVASNGVRRTWRVTSKTPLAEVQLAEPLGHRLLLVFRVYTDGESEFVAVLLGERGLVSRLSLDSADWAETAPLSRFRVVGSSLYQLGSTPGGLFVDRFDLEVK